MPALTISTDNPKRARSPSPSRPPVSPITPTLAPQDAPPSRPALTHSQPDQTGIPPPAPQPIAFDSNPDAIALKSAISILQMQRQRATADIQTLNRAKDAAVRDPEAFIKDLAAGNVNAQGGAAAQGESSDDDEHDAGEGSSKQPVPAPREWATLPKPQNIVRCPPINWSQYAIVGDSLDKLHAEQVARPIQGTPAVVGANGMYEFKGGEGKQEKYPGVAAPYNPLQDRVGKKPRGKK